MDSQTTADNVSAPANFRSIPESKRSVGMAGAGRSPCLGVDPTDGFVCLHPIHDACGLRYDGLGLLRRYRYRLWRERRQGAWCSIRLPIQGSLHAAGQGLLLIRFLSRHGTTPRSLPKQRVVG